MNSKQVQGEIIREHRLFRVTKKQKQEAMESHDCQYPKETW